MRILVFYIFLLGLIPCIFIRPYVGVLLYSWISFMSPQELVWGFPDAIPLALITAVMTVVTWLFSDEPKRLRFDATAWLIVAFMIFTSFTTLVALDPTQSVPMWNRVMKELLFVLITIALTTNRIRFHALLWVMAVSIGYYGFKGGIFALLHGGDYRIYGPADTAIQDNNDLAAGLVVALPLMNYVRMNSAQKWVRIGWLAVMATSFLAILSSYSRGAFLGIVAVSVFLWFKSPKKLIPGMLIFLMMIGALSFMPEKYYARLGTIEHYHQDASAMGRIEIWGVALKIATARPLTGGGFRVTQSPLAVNRYAPGQSARDEHNIYLAVLADHGFIGLLIWIALPFVGWHNSRWLIRHAKGRPEWGWAGDFARMTQVSLVGYAVVGTFGNYAYWDYYFTIIGLLAAARHIMERAAVPKRVAAASTARLSPAAPVTS
jgi:putative inorganic carbon (HCO3(-)) transporter